MASSFATAAVEHLAFVGQTPRSSSVPSSLAGVPRRCRAPAVFGSASRADEQRFASGLSQTASRSSSLLASSVSSSSGSESRISRRFVLAGISGVCGAIGAFNVLFIPDSEATESKQTNLPIEDVKRIIEEDIVQRHYYLTGDLTQSIYDENCRFQDPMTDLSGVKKYAAAVASIFDAETSKHEILNIGVTGPHTVEVSWRLQGYLKLPWHPYISPYEGVTTYTTNEDGLIKSHSETWSISLLTSLIQFLTPSWFNKDAPK